MGAIRSLQLCIIALALFSALFVGYMACQHHAVGDDRSSWDWYGTSGEPSDWQPPARTQANTVRSTSFVDTATLSSPSSVSSVSSASSAAPVPPASAASWATGTMIPRIIHQTWKTKTLPAWGEVPVQTWRDVNPSFEHRLYDDADMARVVKAHYPAIWPHYQRLLPIQKADVFRYVALWAFGGVYADIDVTALEPVDSWGTRLRTRSKLDSAGLLDYRNVDFIVGFEALPLRPDWHAHSSGVSRLPLGPALVLGDAPTLRSHRMLCISPCLQARNSAVKPSESHSSSCTGGGGSLPLNTSAAPG